MVNVPGLDLDRFVPLGPSRKVASRVVDEARLIDRSVIVILDAIRRAGPNG